VRLALDLRDPPAPVVVVPSDEGLPPPSLASAISAAGPEARRLVAGGCVSTRRRRRSPRLGRGHGATRGNPVRRALPSRHREPTPSWWPPRQLGRGQRSRPDGSAGPGLRGRLFRGWLGPRCGSTLADGPLPGEPLHHRTPQRSRPATHDCIHLTARLRRRPRLLVTGRSRTVGPGPNARIQPASAALITGLPWSPEPLPGLAPGCCLGRHGCRQPVASPAHPRRPGRGRPARSARCCAGGPSTGRRVPLGHACIPGSLKPRQPRLDARAGPGTRLQLAGARVARRVRHPPTATTRAKPAAIRAKVSNVVCSPRELTSSPASTAGTESET
jgi:hypothetical protein